MMDAHWVRQQVAAIEECIGDPEAAHSLEDSLRAAILSAIATGDCEDPKAVAAAALESDALPFPRWCA